jgi:hypothetical protein
VRGKHQVNLCRRSIFSILPTCLASLTGRPVFYESFHEGATTARSSAIPASAATTDPDKIPNLRASIKSQMSNKERHCAAESGEERANAVISAASALIGPVKDWFCLILDGC